MPKTNSRPTWDEYFSRIAGDVAKRSTCTRHKYGCVIVNEKHEIIATGYNGVIKGAPHCEDIGCIKDKLNIPSGKRHDICPAVHAEQNALLQAGKSSLKATLYVNAFPCKICSRLMINAGIKKVVVSGNYTDEEGLEILKSAGVEVVEVKIEGRMKNLQNHQNRY